MVHNVQQKINRSKIFLDLLLCSKKFKLFLTSFCRTHSGDNKPCSVVKKRKKKKVVTESQYSKIKMKSVLPYFLLPVHPIWYGSGQVARRFVEKIIHV